MKIDDLPGPKAEKPRLILIQSQPRKVRLSPLVSKIMLHYLRTQKYVLRCRNYDIEGNKVADDCAICLKKSNQPKPYYGLLGIDMSNGKIGWVVVAEKLATKIKIYHNKYEICDWNRGRTISISRYITNQGIDWKISVSRTRTPIESRVRKRIEAFTDSIEDLYPLSYSIINKKGVPKEVEESSGKVLDDVPIEDDFVDLDEKPVNRRRTKQKRTERVKKDQPIEEDFSDENIDEDSFINTEDVVDEENNDESFDEENINFDLDIDSLADEIEDDSIKSFNSPEEDVEEDDDIEFDI